MRHVRSLGFDDLEGRQLLSRVHHLALHTHPLPASSIATPGASLALSGTLSANTRASTVTYDSLGDQTTVTRVSGVLSGVGLVHGIWNESVDINQKYLGPDSIQLHSARGSFVITFDATTLGQGQSTPQGTVYNGAVQHLVNGKGLYAGASETGFIQENTNARHTVVQSLTLSPGTST